MAARCRRLAGGLQSLGVEPGDRVATLLVNCHRYLEAYFAVPGMGAVIVPLNNRYALPELRYVLHDAGVKVLLADEPHAALASELADIVPGIVMAPSDYEKLLDDSPELALENGGEDMLAGIFYTGGTTGAAKGVMLTHRNLVTNALHVTVAFGFSERDIYLHAAPMFHLADGAATYAVTWVGGAHTFVPQFAPAQVLRALESDRVTFSTWVPTMLNAVINHPDLDKTDISSLRMIAHGGSPIAEDLLERAIRALKCSFVQAYGMTEAAPVLTVLAHEEELVGDPRLRSAGREVMGVEVTVRRVDGSGSICLPGEIGEVVARGPNLMRGYWNKPDETAAALRDGWYWSGDLAQTDGDGYLYIVDRAKDMIISGGENVYSIEVENAIYAHPRVLECAVIGVPDDTWGERVHAVVVPKPNQAVTEEEVREHCKALIAGYKCPRSVEFISALPKSGAGKILKLGLREKYWAGRSRQVN